MPSKEMQGWSHVSVCVFVLITVSLCGVCVSVGLCVCMSVSVDERVKHMCLCGGLPF